MNENLKLFFIILGAWCAFWSIVSIFTCIYDKRAAKKNPKHRTSVAMLVCMLIIRHKTKHVKFMLGIPLIIIVQAAAIVGAVFLLK